MKLGKQLKSAPNDDIKISTGWQCHYCEKVIFTDVPHKRIAFHINCEALETLTKKELIAEFSKWLEDQKVSYTIEIGMTTSEKYRENLQGKIEMIGICQERLEKK